MKQSLFSENGHKGPKASKDRDSVTPEKRETDEATPVIALIFSWKALYDF